MRTLTTILLLTLVSVAIAEVATQPASRADILIGKAMTEYNKSVALADTKYAKDVAPYLKRFGGYRDKKILSAGSLAIKILNSARRGAKLLESIQLEQQIAQIRVSLDEKMGSAPKVTAKVPVLQVIGTKFGGHTYLTIVSKMTWEEANEACRKMGGHLVYIETDKERFFVQGMTAGLQHWVGATEYKGDWHWLNKKPVNKGFWHANSPKSNNTRVMFYGEGKLCTVSPRHGGIRGFICEWE